MKPARMPSPVVTQRRAGREFGARTVVMSSIGDLVELLSGKPMRMLLMVLYQRTE